VAGSNYLHKGGMAQPGKALSGVSLRRFLAS